MGTYCVKLVSTIKAGSVVPSLTVDYSTSLRTPVSVQWVSAPVSCPPNSIEVRTLLDEGSTYVHSSQGFALVVP